jgi:hypothetical protein
MSGASTKFTAAQLTSIKATFEAHPEATMCLVEMGHGYGEARYTSTCAMTGDVIRAGESIRKVLVAIRGGRWFEGHIANRTLGALQFRGGHGLTRGGERLYHQVRGDWADLQSYSVSYAVPAASCDWRAVLIGIAESAEEGTAIRLVDVGAQPPQHGVGQDRHGSGIKLVVKRGGKWGRQSAKALVASLRRRKALVAFEVSTMSERGVAARRPMVHECTFGKTHAEIKG